MQKNTQAPGFTIPDIEYVTRRDFLVGGAAALLLNGCGSGEESSSAETRTVEGFYGPVELPVRPKRLIPGGGWAMDYALVLGLPLVAGTAFYGALPEDYPEYQREAYPDVLSDLEMVQADPANYEQIATYEPDVILDSGSSFDEERYERLSQIAPTLAFTEYTGEEGLEKAIWREPLSDIGRAFGLEDRAERLIADYAARAEEMEQRIAERWEGAKFAIVDLNAEGIYVAGTVLDPGSQVLFGDLGVEPASLLTPSAQQLSLEALPDLDADVIFAGVRWKEGSLERDLEAATTTEESPLWQRVPAVERDQVYRFDSEIAYTGPLCAQAFLDVVERNLLG